MRLYDVDLDDKEFSGPTYRLHVRSYEGNIEVHDWTGDLESTVRKFEGLPSAERRYAYLTADSGSLIRWEAIQRVEVNWPC